ncbi:MAG TPA: hypothetical protein VN540_08895 [Clostridia bacterium]|nr:hypothetical protein [Clostridia bacterium]
MNARGRNITLIIAAGLLAVAVLLKLSIAKDDPLADLASEINAYGYDLAAEDFYVLGGAENTTIAALLSEGTDPAPAIAASKACGFPSDVKAMGDITALLANTERGVITVYMRDGGIELCFLQTESGEVLPIQ